MGFEATEAALNIPEFLEADVSGKTGFGDIELWPTAILAKGPA